MDFKTVKESFNLQDLTMTEVNNNEMDYKYRCYGSLSLDL